MKYVGQQKNYIATSTYTEALRETYQIYMEFIINTLNTNK